MHFCDDNIINVIMLKNYYSQKDITCVILSDEADNMGYCVATSEKWSDYMNKIQTHADTDTDTNDEPSDEKIKINI